MLDSVPSFCDRPPAIGNPESLGLETSPGHVELQLSVAIVTAFTILDNQLFASISRSQQSERLQFLDSVILSAASHTKPPQRTRYPLSPTSAKSYKDLRESLDSESRGAGALTD